MTESRLVYTREELQGVHIKDLGEVKEILKDRLHIENEISEDKLGVYGLDGATIEELEGIVEKIVDELRCYEGIFDVDYEFGGEYPIELTVLFEQ